MPKQLNQWRTEHRNFHRLLDLLDREVAGLEEQDSPAYDLLADIVYYLTHYPDSHHHLAEDEFFDIVCRQEPKLVESVRELHQQHGVIATNGAQLHQLLESVMSGGIVPRKQLQEAARQYIDAYRAHMAYEEQLLFPLVEELVVKSKLTVEPLSAQVTDPLFRDIPAKRFKELHRQIAENVECDCEIEI